MPVPLHLEMSYLSNGVLEILRIGEEISETILCGNESFTGRKNFFLREAVIRLDNVGLALFLPWVHPLSSPCRSPPRVLVSEGWCRL